MAKSSTSFKPGQVANPRGRPPKARALTAILERAGNQKLDVGGERISGKRLIARMAWDVATKGEVTLPSGRTLVVAPADWFDVVKWIYTHIDGPAKQAVEMTGANGGPVDMRLSTDGISDDERAARIAAIFDAARTRQTRQTDSTDEAGVS